jgi:hypothetical protein
MRSESQRTPADIMTRRLRLLPHRLRVAHLLALISRQSPDSVRGCELTSLLHDEMTAQVGEAGGLR